MPAGVALHAAGSSAPKSASARRWDALWRGPVWPLPHASLPWRRPWSLRRPNSRFLRSGAPAYSPRRLGNPHRRCGEVWFDGRWGKPAEAEAAGWFEYRDRWLPKSIEPKLRQWEKEDAKGLAWNRSYTLKTRHYQLRTNVPRFVAELELRPFLDALYAHFTVTFRERFGLEGKGANMKTVNVYAGYATYFAQTQRPRSNPGYIVGGAELHVLYEDADLGGFYQTMFHEGTHQFVAGLLPGVALNPSARADARAEEQRWQDAASSAAHGRHDPFGEVDQVLR